MSPQLRIGERLLLEHVFCQLLPEQVTLFVHPEKRALAVFWEPGDPENVIEFFTLAEWSILLVLAESYPHYSPYEWLLQATASSTERYRLFKPVHRALSSLRKKLQHVHPYLNISHVYETGYALTSPAAREFPLP